MAELKVLKVGDVIKFAKEAVYTDAAKNEAVIPMGTELKVISVSEAMIELECKIGEKVQSVILDSKDPNLSGDAISQAKEDEKPVKQDAGALKVDNGPTGKDPNLSKDNATKASEKPGEVKQGAGSLDKDKNGGSAADPTLNKDNVAKTPEKAGEPGKQGDSSLNKDEGPSGKDPQLNKDNVKKIGDIKLRDSVDPNLSKENTHQEAGSQAPVKQNKAALDVDKNKGKEADPNLSKDDLKKVGEGKLPTDPAGEVDQKYINDLLEKHGLQETAEEKEKREKAEKEAKSKKKGMRERRALKEDEGYKEGEEWYEVFIDRGEESGTETLEGDADTYAKALEIKAKLEKENPGNKYGIDKWRMVGGFAEPIDGWTPEKEAAAAKEKSESIEVEVVGLTAVPHVAEPKGSASESTEVIESMRKESEGMILQEGIGLAPKKGEKTGKSYQDRIEALAKELEAETEAISKKDAADMRFIVKAIADKNYSAAQNRFADMDTAARDTFIGYFTNDSKDKKALELIRDVMKGWDIGEATDDAAAVEKVIAGLR